MPHSVLSCSIRSLATATLLFLGVQCGVAGPPGETGDTGPPGPMGAQGLTGPPGMNPAPASPEYYQGTAGPNGITLNSFSWVGIHTAVTDIQDVLRSSGITRANSSFTFARGGIYVMLLRVNTVSSTGILFMRARRVNGTQATLLSNAIYTNPGPAQAPDGLYGLISVAAGDQIELQYQTSPDRGTYAGWGFIGNEARQGGEPNHTANISFFSLSLN